MQSFIINLSLFLIVAICLYLSFTYLYILRESRKLNRSWLELKELFNGKFALCASLLEVVKDTYHKENEILKSLTDNINAFLSAKRPEDLSMTDRKMAYALARLERLMEKYPLIYHNTAYVQLNNDLIKLEEKISFSRQFYNKAVETYNQNITRMPVGVVSAIFNIHKKSYL